MQRDIKFRVWGGSKRMIPWEELRRLHIGTVFQDAEGYHVMQFTGLKDKNGKEIYEGDIVRVHNFSTKWKRGEPDLDWRVFEIKYNRYVWQFYNSVISMPMSDYDVGTLEPYDIEVIGNIHENPALLSNPQ